MQKRQKHRTELHDMVAKRFAERDQADWILRFEAEDTTCVHVHDYREALDHPQVEHRAQLTSRAHPLDGEVWTVGVPLMDRAYNDAITRPPTLGENTADVLEEWLGWDKLKIKKFVQK